jgi:hypothetical protein
MLKRRITKAEFEALSEALQAEYKKAAGSDNYNLDTDTDESSAALLTAKQREKQRADEAEKKLLEAETKLAEVENATSGALDAAAVIKLKADHKAALDKAANDAKALVDAKHKQLEEVMLDSEAMKIATELSIVPDIFAGEVRKRLTLEEVDGKPVVKVLDEKGTVTEKKIEDLGEEFLANDKFAAILTGSRASGGGASGSPKGGRATAKKLSEMTATEEAAFANEKPVEYAKMVEAESGSIV